MHGEAPQPLNFGYQATCISLGRRDGLVQGLKPDGEPTTTILRGRGAAWFKELVCRFTVTGLYLERHFNVFDWTIARPQEQKPLPQKRLTHSQGL
jgi:hypothetical protein